MASAKIYQVEEDIHFVSLKYFFVSTGTTHIVKVVEYRYVQDLNEQALFNLGFGDYDIDADTIFDRKVSNNGDAYTVFNTVLSTVPKFFASKPNAIMMVQGSDSTDDYIEECKMTCKKKCEDYCKNSDRRISTYRNYVNKNFDKLSEDYTFYGGVNQPDGSVIMDLYQVGGEYKSLFCKIK